MWWAKYKVGMLNLCVNIYWHWPEKPKEAQERKEDIAVGPMCWILFLKLWAIGVNNMDIVFPFLKNWGSDGDDEEETAEETRSQVQGSGESDTQESELELIHSSECIISGRNGARSLDLNSGLPHGIHLAPVPYLDPGNPLLRPSGLGVGGLYQGFTWPPYKTG